MIVQCINTANCGKQTTREAADARSYRTGLCEACGWPLEDVKDRQIIAAAILWNGIVFTGDHHGNIMQYLVKIKQLVVMSRDKITDKDQGFIENTGRYLSREDARLVAIIAGQIKPDHGVLYSEDLW